MKLHTSLAATAFGLALTATSALAEDCAVITVEDQFELEADEIVALYDCLADKLAEGYGKADGEVGTNYRSWAPTSTRPAIQGTHGNRILNTFANDIAAEQYLKYHEEDFTMPLGLFLAKESITISIKKNGTSRPTFDDDQNGSRSIPETNDWL